jgi:hypothetical protein
MLGDLTSLGDTTILDSVILLRQLILHFKSSANILSVKKCDEEKPVDNAMLQNVLVIVAFTNEILHVRQILNFLVIVPRTYPKSK